MTRKFQIEIDFDIRRIYTPEELKGYLSVANTVFGSDNTIESGYYKGLLADPNYALFSGYVDNEPVASGLLQMPTHASFGLLFAGSVLPAQRRKGFYREWVRARAELASKKGFKYISTEANGTSRPILEKLGFIPLVRETTWLLPVTETIKP